MISPLYRSLPLPDDKTDIRLLSLLPAADQSAPVICHLSTVALADAQNTYEALSYHWCGPVDRSILVNDIEVSINTNLFDALIALRRNDHPRTLWIDAICIDQESNAEKGEKCHQIRLMRDIYQKSRQTVAWLGLAADGEAGTHLVPDFIQTILQIKRKMESDERIKALSSHDGYYIPMIEEYEIFGIPEEEHPGYRALADLLSRDWWKRVWVIQEVSVAPEAMLQCGQYCFDMAEVISASNLAWLLSAKGFEELDSRFSDTGDQRNKEVRGVRDNLLALVIDHIESRASWPHDKIYGLCGLAHDAGPDGLDMTFDYTKTPQEVYTNFARSVLRTYGNLDILSALSVPKMTEGRAQSLPSWVPNWQAIESNPNIIYQRPRSFHIAGDFQVLFTATNASVSEPNFGPDGKSMCLEGHILDSIARVGSVKPMNLELEAAIKILLEWRNNVARCNSRWRYSPTKQLMVDVFYHAITMANCFNHLKTPVEKYRIFDRTLVSRPNTTSGSSWLAAEGHGVLSAAYIARNRRLSRTKKGYLALVPGETKVGDKVGLFKGGALPLVVRKVDGGVWEMVGDSYVHGVMMGEAYDKTKLKEFWFI